MSERARLTDRQRQALLVALETAGYPDAELMERHARGERLSAEERAEVERALREQPGAADELRLLRDFSLEGRRAVAGRPPAPARRGRAPRRARSRWSWLALPAAAAAAALLVVYLLPADPDPGEGGLPQQIARLDDPADPQRPVVGGDPAPPRAQPVAPAPPAEPVESADAPPPGGTGEAVAARQAPGAVDPPTAAPPPEPPRPDPEPGPDPEAPIFVAMLLPEYDAPPGAAARPRLGTAIRAPDPRAPGIRLLAPEHVATTGRAAPRLHWHLDRAPVSGQLSFALVDETRAEPLVEVALPAGDRGGLRSIDLGALGVELPVGRELTWSVAWSATPDGPLASYAIASIERVPRQPVLPRDRGAHAAAYAAAGLWYDALDAVLALAGEHPGDPEIDRALGALLGAAGLPDLDPR